MRSCTDHGARGVGIRACCVSTLHQTQSTGSKIAVAPSYAEEGASAACTANGKTGVVSRREKGSSRSTLVRDSPGSSVRVYMRIEGLVVDFPGLYRSHRSDKYEELK